MAITLSELKNILDYDADIGIFTWKIKSGCQAEGYIAGSSTASGHLKVSINGENYRLHNLAWFYVNGVWPIDTLDHINGDKQDNRISNLREATLAQNNWNRGANKNNTMKLKNIIRVRDNYYRVKIEKNGQKYEAYFHDLNEAIAWRDQKNKELHGDFAKV
jgi:hypothetical protein